MKNKNMRKKLLFPLLIPALTFAFSSCANSQSFNGKIYIEFGRMYTGEEESVPSMNYETLKSRIENGETFAMVISRNPLSSRGFI